MGKNIENGDALWLNVLYGRENYQKADTRSVLLGYEKRKEDFLIGAGYAYFENNAKGRISSMDADSHIAFVYGEYKPESGYINLALSYGKTLFYEKGASSYRYYSLTGQITGGYDFGFLTPETGIRYQNIRNGYYTESSGISKNKNTNDILTGLLSLKIEKEFQIIQGLALAPQAKASVLYDITQADQYFNGFYEGTLTSFHQKTGSRLATEFQLGINFATSFGMNAFIGYNGVFRGARKNHGFSMTFSYEI